MELIVVLFSFGLSAGVIGKIKGSSFILWAIVGFCLPFVGTLAAVLYRSEREEPKRRCDNCSHVMPIHVQVCSQCGEDLYFPDEVLAPRPEPRAGAPGGRV